MNGTTTVTYRGKVIARMTNRIVTTGKNIILDYVVQSLDKEDPRYDECPCCGTGYIGVRRCACRFSWMLHPMFRGYCPTCRQPYHPMFDHVACAVEQMQVAGRAIGERLARRQNQAVWDAINGPNSRRAA